MEYRMYSMVLRQLNPMQKGIQALHAVVEYANKYFNESDYRKWAVTDKTMIVLDGGTSTELADVIDKLEELGVKYSTFTEPDLYNNITAVAFIASEKVWDRENYPDLVEFTNNNSSEAIKVLYKYGPDHICPDALKEYWIKTVFDEKPELVDNLLDLRNLIFSKKLSQ